MNLEDFLIDFLNYYTNDCTRRVLGRHKNLHKSGHVYRNSPTSEGDPVGRHCSEQLAIDIDLKHHGGLISGVNKSLIAKLPEWMQEIPLHILSSVQSMHDGDGYWDIKKGLTPEGKKWLKNFIINNKLNEARFEKYLSQNVQNA